MLSILRKGRNAKKQTTHYNGRSRIDLIEGTPLFMQISRDQTIEVFCGDTSLAAGLKMVKPFIGASYLMIKDSIKQDKEGNILFTKDENGTEIPATEEKYYILDWDYERKCPKILHKTLDEINELQK